MVELAPRLFATLVSGATIKGVHPKVVLALG
jgi:hypothetical protein